MGPDTGQLVAEILNAAYLVRHYARGGRSHIHRKERARAILTLGMAIGRAFAVSQDYEPLLAAILDGLRPKDDPPF